jgi:tyrosine-protein kinase Etk/Wzc
MANSSKEIQFNVLDLIIPLTRRKKTVLFITLLFVGIGVLVAFKAEEEFKAVAIVMPKEDNSDLLSSYIKNMPMAKSQLKGNIFSPATDLENVYLAILKSRKLQVEVIKKFDLANVYKFKKQKYFMEDVIKEYERHVTGIVSDEGMLYVTVTDNSPTRAADIANYVIDYMDNIYSNLSAEMARNQRLFLEARLNVIKRNLLLSEDSLAQFQIENGVVDIEQQAKSTIEAAATIEVRLLAAELDLNMAKRIFLADNKKIQEMEMNFEEIKKQRDKLSQVRETDFLIPLKIAPAIGVRFLRLKRSLKIQEILFELVTQQYETSKLEEAKNTPHIQILDRAEAPQKRSKPQRRNMVMGAFFGGIFFNLILLNILETFKRFRQGNSENYRKMVMIVKSLWR